MMFWTALMAPLLALSPGFAQDPVDELRKEIEKLKKSNADLLERVTLLEQGSVDDAQTIQRLRQVVKLLESNIPATEPSAPKNTGDTPKVKPIIAPVISIKGKLVYVDAKN